jgi:small subunit ribosomal protein S8
MSLTDPIANYLTCLRNALQAKRQKVDIPSSNLLVESDQALERGRVSSTTTKLLKRAARRSARLLEVREQGRAQ